MSNIFTILKVVICSLCSIFFLNSCTSAPEKTEHQVHTVDIKQMKFQPTELTVQKGDTIVWINHDIVTHDVTEEKHKLWTSGPLAPGETWSLLVTQSADYYCSIHVVMKGKVLVQ